MQGKLISLLIILTIIKNGLFFPFKITHLSSVHKKKKLLYCSNFNIYIEHTDMFNVVYNANYLSFIERAISGRDMSNCRITRFKTLKFRSPARLGDKIQVNITQPIGSNKISSKVFSSSAEYSSCNNIEYQKKFAPLNNIINVKDVSEFNIISGGKKHVSEFTVWTDELGREGYLISKTILQLMERARTDILGVLKY